MTILEVVAVVGLCITGLGGGVAYGVLLQEVRGLRDQVASNRQWRQGHERMSAELLKEVGEIKGQVAVIPRLASSLDSHLQAKNGH